MRLGGIKDVRTFVKVLSIAAMCAAAHAASAATIDVSVDARSGPYDQSANPKMTYDSAALAPTVIKGSLVAGSGYTFVSSGTTQTVSFYNAIDGGGYQNLSTTVGVPSQYIPGMPQAYIEELLGAFADNSGKVLSLFVIGVGGTFVAPTGASEILLGINDNNYSDNLGALTVAVSGAGISAFPLPASAPMFGAALVALGAIGYGAKRKKAAAAA